MVFSLARQGLFNHTNMETTDEPTLEALSDHSKASEQIPRLPQEMETEGKNTDAADVSWMQVMEGWIPWTSLDQVHPSS